MVLPYARLLALSLAMALMPSPAAAGTSTGRVEFELYRSGHVFGRQSVTVSERGGALVAEINAALHAGLGPVTLFSYTQQCRETWRGGALASLSCSTRKNGRNMNVSGAAANGVISISGISARTDFPLSTLPTSWWTRPPLSTREMINSETGERLPVRVSLVGRETIVTNGVRMSTDRIRVQGTVSVDLWYDDAGHWVGCAFTAQGQHITYRLLSAPADGPA